MGQAIWWCGTCGYEVREGGICPLCNNQLLASPLPELEQGTAEEVGYQLDGWGPRTRCLLISGLIRGRVPHRFEGKELVILSVDEDRVDLLTTQVRAAGDPGPPRRQKDLSLHGADETPPEAATVATSFHRSDYSGTSVQSRWPSPVNTPPLAPAPVYPPAPWNNQFTQPLTPSSRRFSRMAIWAFVFSLLWIYGVGSLLALILAIVALAKLGQKRGKGLAIAAIVLSGLGLIVAAIVIAAASSNVTTTGSSSSSMWDPCTTSQTMPYPVLVKDPDSLDGKCVHYQAEVFQYDSSTGTNSMLVEVTNVGYGLWDNLVAVNLPSASLGSHIYQDDIVELVGRVNGTETYQTRLNGQNTVPVIDATQMHLVSSGSS